MSAFERREQIIERMRIRKFDSINNLAHEFGVSRRTIINDIQELVCSGYPIQANIGRGGGICWTGNKKQFPFSEKEINSLKIAIDLVPPQNKIILENLLCSNVREEAKANDIFEIFEKYKTQREVACKLNISESYLSRLLSGQKKPSIELTERILKLKTEDSNNNDDNT